MKAQWARPTSETAGGRLIDAPQDRGTDYGGGTPPSGRLVDLDPEHRYRIL